jgi:hypothetical protein
VGEVIATYDQALVDTLCLNQEHPLFSPEQFTVAAFKTFEALSKHHLEPIEYSIVLSLEEEQHISPFALRAALDRLVSLNLLTFPSTHKPSHVQYSCRALHFAWQHAREVPSVRKAVSAAYAHLEP